VWDCKSELPSQSLPLLAMAPATTFAFPEKPTAGLQRFADFPHRATCRFPGACLARKALKNAWNGPYHRAYGGMRDSKIKAAVLTQQTTDIREVLLVTVHSFSWVCKAMV
jgi:hypothetical protein